MKLELIRTKEQREENTIVKKSVYKLGGYYDVLVTEINNVSGKRFYKIISISADFEKHTKNYLPEIYFNESKSQFEIQTTSWGAMDTNEIKKAIAGCSPIVTIHILSNGRVKHERGNHIFTSQLLRRMG